MSDWNGLPEDWGAGHYRNVPVSKWVKLSRERQVRDLGRQRTPDFPYYYDDKAADRAVWFISQLKHFKGRQWSGKPFILEAWQEWDIIRPLFGWKRCSDGMRRFRRLLLKVARKNGKTGLGAAIGLYMLIADGEPAAECYCAATKEEQAKQAWRAARGMYRRSELLADEIEANAKTLLHRESESFFRPLGRDSNTEDGLDIHFGLCDEYHAHKTDEMLGVLETGTGTRSQPLIVITSTEGLTKGPLREEENLCKKILEQPDFSNEQYLIYICDVDDPEKWESEDEWYKANPMLCISLKLEDFQAECKLAQQSTSRRIHFKVKRLNIPCSAEHVWIGSELFKRCEGPVDWNQFVGKRCFAGLDLGSTGDISALVLAFMDERDKDREKDQLPRVYLKSFFWVPEVGQAERWKNDGVCYPLWAQQGYILTSPGEITRNSVIRAKINELSKIYEIAELASDKWNAGDLMQDLEGDGLTVISHPQNMASMSLPCKTFYKLVIEGLIRHNDNPILNWMVPNAVAITDGNENIKLMKNKSKDRIDGVVAAVMAIGRLAIAPEPVRSVYEERGLVAL